MKELIQQWDGTPFPEMIRGLDEIDIPVDGIRGWLLQGGSTQAVFFDIEPVGVIEPHHHCSQWGIVVMGEMDLTIDGQEKTYKAGDWYYIPEGVVHSASFKTRVHVIDIFDDGKRYSPRK